MMPLTLKTGSSIRDQEWIGKGVDIWLIRDNLKLSFEERVAQHQDTLNLIDALKQMGLKNRAGSSSTTQITGSKPR